jgi:ABC-2 type transport system permease protein
MSQPGSSPVLHAQNVVARFARKTVLQELTLAVSSGEIYALLGSNGAGKTTTLSLFLGFVTPASGRVFVNGVDVAAEPTGARKHIAYIPENVALYEQLSARENLAYLLDVAGERKSTGALDAALSQAGLEDAAFNRRVGSFSKGMRQKVAIGLALARQAPALLLDEPTSGLDPRATEDFNGLLRMLRARGVAVLMVTHDLLSAADIADRIGFIERGRIVEEVAAEGSERFDVRGLHPPLLRAGGCLRTVLRIARQDLKLMLRDRVALLGSLLFAALTVTAAVSATDHMRRVEAERTRHQAEADREFKAQPDRHPHRMVHYGHFIFRPLEPLAAFDPGVEAYTGRSLFLEGHRQNTASFGDVRQSSLLLRFGRLSPALVLQLLAPVLLIFVAYGAIARERERGTLRVLLAQGVSSISIMLGKALAVASLAVLVLSPALVALLWIGAAGGAPWSRVVALAGSYGIWMLIWSLGIVLVSSRFSRARDALLALLGVWAVAVLLVPRIVPDIANAALTLPTKFETDIAVERDLKALGDPHDPGDARFAQFRQQLLARYGVSGIEDLPVNYKGVLAVEGEKNSTALFNRYAHEAYVLEDRQAGIVDALGITSPAVALQRLSMVVSGSDLQTFRGFLEQAETYRYDMMQRLNRLEADVITYEDDNDPDKENRIDRAHWSAIPAFAYQLPQSEAVLRRAVAPLMVLLGWFILLAGMTTHAALRMAKRP